MANGKRKCPYCKEYNRHTEGVLVNNSLFCSYDHASKYAVKIKPKGTKIREKDERKELKKRKEAAKSYSQVAAEAETAVRRYIRARDYYKPCISCGTTKDVQYAAGHYKTSGGHKELRFNVFNMHKQCNKYCNNSLSGNITGNNTSIGYTQGLINRYGQWIVDYLQSHHELKKYTREELARIKRIFNKRASWYEKKRGMV